MKIKRTGYPKTWKLTTKQIALTTGKSIGQVREDVRQGRCNPAMLFEFACYIVGHHSSAVVKRRKKRCDAGQKRIVALENSTCLDYGDSQERGAYQSPLDKPIDPGFKWET